jgi:hypothetical protein
VVRITAPKDGQHVGTRTRVLISVDKADQVTYVALYKDGAVMATDFTAPYEIEWETRADAEGPHTLQARAVGTALGEVTSLRLTVTVDHTPPTVSLAAPADHATLVGAAAIRATASDTLGAAAVTFFVDGAELASMPHAPYEAMWETGRMPNGHHTLQARAVDLAGHDATSEPVTVWVANPNEPPVLDPPQTTTVLEGNTLTLPLKAIEPNSPRDPIVYAAEQLPAWLTLDPQTGVLSGTPGFDEASREKPLVPYLGITVQACDPEPLCSTQPLTISVVNANRMPILEPVGPQTVEDGNWLVIKFKASDPDGDPITCRVKQLPPWMRFDAQECIARGVPSDETGPLTEPTMIYPEVIAEWCDPDGLCAKESFMVTVTGVGNQPPVLTAPATASIAEGQRLVVEIQATDPEDETVILTAEPLPEGAVFTDHTDGTGVFRWTPRSDQHGSYDVLLKAADKEQETVQRVQVTVQEASLSISGFIKDVLGLPVEGALVEVGTTKATLRMVSTDAQGYYLAGDLPPGTYTMTPSYQLKETFSTVARTQLEVMFAPEKTRVILTDSDKTGTNFTATFPAGSR